VSDYADDLARVAGAGLRTRWLGKPLRYVSETGSTNDDVRAEAARGAGHGLGVVADAQTAGRGRRGRGWFSPRGESVYCSVLLRPANLPSDRAGLLALAAGLAVAEAVDPWVRDERVTVKWPNDVRVGGKKVSGVLVEGVARADAPGYFVLGVGLNVNGDALPDELAATATTLRIARGGARLDRGEVFAGLCARLETRLDSVLRGDATAVLEALRARCDTLGTRVSVDGVSGLAGAIADDGALVIRRDDGSETSVRSGEVLAG
jgi:BirA family biotin operon repressor/biotin-[acetyl-CoA-carboxylase] ligase